WQHSYYQGIQPLQYPYVAADGPAGKNALHIPTVDDKGWGAGTALNISIADGSGGDVFHDPDDLYIRTYFRVHQSHMDNLPQINNNFMGIDTPNNLDPKNPLSWPRPHDGWPELNTQYNIRLDSRLPDTPWVYLYREMETEKWYCYEIHVHKVNDSQEEWYIRLDGEDVTDEFISVSSPNVNMTLLELYAQGTRYINEYWGNLWISSHDNVALTEGYDFAAIEIRDDTWPGCFDETPCADGETRSCSTNLDGICSQGEQTCSNEEWGTCGQTVFPGTEICDDGLDNDCDSGTDCDDNNCDGTPECPVCVPATEICNNGRDDDCDGLVDCDDILNCPASLPECEITCEENWSCDSWSSCSNETQTRNCTDANDCGTEIEKPPETQGCTVDTGLLFESNWNTETGYSDEAINDGTKWNSFSQNEPLQRAYVSSDGPGGNNYLNVVTPGGGGSGNPYGYKWFIVGDEGEYAYYDPDDLYVRVYFRMHQSHIDNFPVSNHNFMGLDSPIPRLYTAHYLAWEPNHYAWPELNTPFLNRSTPMPGGPAWIYLYKQMETERWYCFETHVHNVGGAEEWYYNLDGVDVTGDFIAVDDGDKTLLELYAEGKRYEDKYHGNLWIATYDNEALEEGYDFTSVSVRSDGWSGCYGPEAIVDAQDCEISISEFSAIGSAVNNCSANNLEYQYEAGTAVQNWVTSLPSENGYNIKIENLTTGTEQNLVLNSNSEGKLQFSS
ncbi:MAG: hypothetical protein ABID38_07285, partial [Candidatus Diapherotrites archaeon]